ncbi:hypothetical protein GOL39_32195 [Sinorhizobium medicae]|nr:hypothetical protein [Sinorhizobium medicae]
MRCTAELARSCSGHACCRATKIATTQSEEDPVYLPSDNAEPELNCWMPMPSANLNRTSMPSRWEGDDERELDGSGI